MAMNGREAWKEWGGILYNFDPPMRRAAKKTIKGLTSKHRVRGK
jgi:hypothetical protein